MSGLDEEQLGELESGQRAKSFAQVSPLLTDSLRVGSVSLRVRAVVDQLPTSGDVE
jgi:hypothetical protein